MLHRHLAHGVSQAVEVLAIGPRRAMRMRDLLCNLLQRRRTKPVDVLRPMCMRFTWSMHKLYSSYSFHKLLFQQSVAEGACQTPQLPNT
jgi:hypothetical protein